MGPLTVPSGGPAYLDANAFIYTVERMAPYHTVLDPFWRDVRASAAMVVTSELTWLEVLVGPLKTGDVTLQATYRAVLDSSPDVRMRPVSRTVLERAATLRAQTGLKTPDAIHAATAIIEGCALFVTNDAAFRRIPGLNVTVLRDLLSP